METTFIKEVRNIAGPQRENTFAMVADVAVRHGFRNIVETGVYRGIHFDGQSTLIWANIAEITGGHVTAIDISPDSIRNAGELLLARGKQDYVTLIQDDSLKALEDAPDGIEILYLDSYDHDPNNPGPCQEHQLKEAEICLPKMAERSVILLDDCIFETGGKSGMSHPYLISHGWRLVTSQYQNLYQRVNSQLF